MISAALLLIGLAPLAYACNMNVGAYKLHNGQGEMSYMDQERSALYSEQGVWVSWKVPVPRHWDPKTGQMRNEGPGRSIGKNYAHWNQLADENPPMGTPSPAQLKAANAKVVAPDPYREYLRARQKQPYNPATDDDLYFLSAGHSPEHGTNIEAGVIRAQRPKIPAAYLGALKRPSFSFNPEDNEDGTAGGRGNTRPLPTITEATILISESPLLIEVGSGDGAADNVAARSTVTARQDGKVITID